MSVHGAQPNTRNSLKPYSRAQTDRRESRTLCASRDILKTIRFTVEGPSDMCGRQREATGTQDTNVNRLLRKSRATLTKNNSY